MQPLQNAVQGLWSLLYGFSVILLSEFVVIRRVLLSRFQQKVGETERLLPNNRSLMQPSHHFQYSLQKVTENRLSVANMVKFSRNSPKT